ncbi:hypothetical protein [Allosalinactinospora lopnorensis]|uniref:hypothetical protein n=1 Tax=Allosalinactinospora lopnorensis TaxID=1352348 RepID=UPI000623CD38|nr:hypothetical protein [Allosalinactinospora lopnorensis]
MRETHRLLPSPTEDLLRRYRRGLLQALADDHGTTRYAELRWHVPALTGASTPRLPDVQRGLSVHPRAGPPPAGPALN